MATTGTADQPPAALIPYYFSTFLALGQKWVICYFAELLQTQNLNFERDIYESTGWEDLNVEQQKEVRLILMKSQTPPTLSAYKFFTINMLTFTSFVKTSYSYFTLLKVIYTGS